MAEEASNRLGACTSPYLLQHAENPVAWQPWDDEAIELARKLDRPLLVSIGYAACHWCHVMEHESFEDEDAAALMNEKLVCIKVDREERPDVDALYMAACQATTGGGGWPLNAFVDPHTLQPFFAGTYFPPEQRFGRPSWKQLVDSISKAWDDDREKVLESAATVTAHLNKMASSVKNEQDLTAIATEARLMANQHASRLFDPVNGGFGGAPKFPHPMELEGLLRSEEKEMVATSLDIMASRGLYDHLAGGWHRYCVDAAWAVPHFEKMLYDNALLLAVHEQARRKGVGSHNERVIRLTLDWIHSEMLDPDGGVWSTLDADSLGEDGKSEEGEFYLWRQAEAEDLQACERFGITEKGNFEDTDRSVLSLHEIEGLEYEEDERLRNFLLEKRSHRSRPGTDDKVLTAWNGMLLVACAQLPEEQAKLIGEHIVKDMLSREDILRTRRGQTLGGMGFLDDHAWAALGLLHWGLRWDEEDCILKGQEITEQMIERFSDPEGGFWLSSSEHTDLPVRQRSVSDSAVPGATAVAIEVLRLLLNRWPDHAKAEQWRNIAEQAIRSAGREFVTRAGAHWALVNAAQGIVEPAAIWFIHHSGDEPKEVEELRRSADWNQLVVSSSNPIDDKDRGEEEWMGWLCEEMSCQPPITKSSELIWE